MLSPDGHQPQNDSSREPVDWSDEELGVSELGDQRRVKRLLNIARNFYARPQSGVPQACQSRAETKTDYHFFGDQNHTMEKILKPHYEATQQRVKQEKVVLAVQVQKTKPLSVSGIQDIGNDEASRWTLGDQLFPVSSRRCGDFFQCSLNFWYLSFPQFLGSFIY